VRVLVTGSRNWVDRDAIKAEMVRVMGTTAPQEMILVSGAQRSWDRMAQVFYGADYLAEQVAEDLGWIIEQYPADWDTHGRAAGPIRNAVMVKTGADVCLAFPMTGSRGTIDCMRRAKVARIPVIVRTPAMTVGVPWEG
jgi:hypothetical protein